MQSGDSEFLRHVSCDACGSSDANALYSDGHTHCFSCGATVKGDGEVTAPRDRMIRFNPEFVHGEAQALSKRALTEDATRKYGYEVGEFKGRPVQIANYRRDGKVVAQKLRFADKSFTVIGNLKEAGLYGQHLWQPGRRIVVTEGEIDAITVAQVQDLRWPVVSVPNGAQGAKKSIAKELAWLEQFDEVVLMFDMDEPGQQAAQECAALFTPGKARIAQLPAKDPNELLTTGRAKEIVQAMFNASTYRPDGIVTIADIREKALTPTQTGLPWPWPRLTELTYGRRYGEVYAFGAGTGIGKTDVFTQVIEQTAVELNEKCGVFYLEQPPDQTVKRIAGKLAHKRFHVPDAGWTPDELRAAVDKLEKTGNVFFYDSFGVVDWEVLRGRMKYLVHAHGVKHIFLDHLTALAAEADDERKEIEKIMAQIAMFAEEHGVCFYFISHLATPEGKPHEEGGRVMIRHFKGSRSIGFWSHFMFGLERDQQVSDPVRRRTTTVRVLKDRLTGQGVGELLYLLYDTDTGMLNETAAPDYAFGDEGDDF